MASEDTDDVLPALGVLGMALLSTQLLFTGILALLIGASVVALGELPYGLVVVVIGTVLTWCSSALFAPGKSNTVWNATLGRVWFPIDETVYDAAMDAGLIDGDGGGVDAW